MPSHLELSGGHCGAEEGEILAGIAGLCLALETGHTIWEITDNFGVAAGNHRLTFGIHGERIDLVDDAGCSGRRVVLLQPGLAGAGTRRPTSGTSRCGGLTGRVRVNQIGVYLQDQWLPTPRLTVTAGLRLDVPFLPKAPRQNPTALRSSASILRSLPAGTCSGLRGSA